MNHQSTRSRSAKRRTDAETVEPAELPGRLDGWSPAGFDPLLLLRQPHYSVDPMEWVEHIPFASWVMRASNPKLFVELGTHAGNAYCAFCQAVADDKLATSCVAIDRWQSGQDILAQLNRHHDERYAEFSSIIQSSFEDALRSFDDGTIDLLHIMHGRSDESAKHTFETWQPKLSRNAIVLLHGIAEDGAVGGVQTFWNELEGKFRTFSFPHDRGLGVLATGAVPPGLGPLLDGDKRRVEEIRTLFGTIGGALAESVNAKLRVHRAEQARIDAEDDAAASRLAAARLAQRLGESDLVHQEIGSLREALLAQDGGRAGAAEQAEILAAVSTKLTELSDGIAVLNSKRDGQAQAMLKLADALSKTQSDLRDLKANVDGLPAQNTTALKDMKKQVTSEIKPLKSGIAQLSQVVSAFLAADRQGRSLDVRKVLDLLNEAQAENTLLRRNMSDVILDATLAWTRYSDLLSFIDRQSANGNADDIAALRDTIEEGILEARRQKAAALGKRPGFAVTGDHADLAGGPAPVAKSAMPGGADDTAVHFVGLTVGKGRNLRPRFTVICASDEKTVSFSALVDSIRSSAGDDVIEIFAPVTHHDGFPGSRPVETGGGGLISQINSLILEHATGQVVAIASAPGTLADGWMHGLQAVLDDNALAAAASGIVLADDRTVAWSGAFFAPNLGWRLADVQLPVEDYHVASAARFERVAPGFVAFAPDVYRELDGLKSFDSLASALLEYSKRAVEAGFEIYRAPGARLTLPGEWYGREALLVQHFEDCAWHDLRPGLRRRPRVLVVDALTPKPDQDAGSVATFWDIRILQSFGYEVTFVPMYDTAHAGRYTDALCAHGVYCPVAPQLKTAQNFLESNGHEFDLIILCRVVTAHLLIDVCRASAPQAKLIFHTVDLHFLREERQASLLQTAEAHTQAQNTRKEEIRCIGSADAAILVSRHEYDLIGELLPDAKRILLPITHPVSGRLAPRTGRRGLMFVGGFSHAPNLDAVAYLLDEIWDLIREQNPDLTLSIVGSRAPDHILDRHDPARGIEILGFVPDLQPLYAKALVNIAPLRFGAGIKGKILAAMGVGIPVVATSVAAEGMGLTNGADVMIGDDPRAIADAVTRLCRDEALWTHISDTAIATAQAEFSVDAQIPRWRSILRSLSLPT